MTSSTPQVREGRVPFTYDSLPKSCETWYRIHGDLESSSTGRPLIILHGGPGMCHNYMKDLELLASKHGVSLVFYDQIGCGNSTRLREKRLDSQFWKTELFEAELDNLIRHLNISEYDILGQSWGGMLAGHYAINRPPGLKRLIISNSPASMKLWVESCNGRRRELPPEVAATIEKYEATQDYGNQAYKDAVEFFYKRYMCRVPGEDGATFPKSVMETLANLDEDDTVYFTMNGPSEFTIIGNLRDWSVVGRLHNINVPTLVLNGEFDEAQDFSVEPYAKEIPDAVWKKLPGTGHCGHVEKTDEYCHIVMEFFRQHT